MIIPIRCFTCGKVVADKYDYYITAAKEASLKPNPASGGVGTGTGAVAGKVVPTDTKHFDPEKTGHIMDKLGLTRYCCRRHMLTTVDMMEVI